MQNAKGKMPEETLSVFSFCPLHFAFSILHCLGLGGRLCGW
jgi:hypothetical protein